MTDPTFNLATPGAKRADTEPPTPTDDPRTLAPSDGQTLLTPPVDPLLLEPAVTIPSDGARAPHGALPPQTLVFPEGACAAGNPSNAMEMLPAPAAPVPGHSPAVPVTVSPTDNTLIPPEETTSPLAACSAPSTRVVAGLQSNVEQEHSGTLLDAHLTPAALARATAPPPPLAPRATAPGLALAAAPSTVARTGLARTGTHVPLATLPTVAGYEVLGELGRGGMGVVYRARQQGLNRLVALKMVLAAGRASHEELARFRAEAEAVAYMHHPNIVQVYEVGTHGGQPYFSLEFCPGGTLSERTGGRAQAPRLAAQIVRDLAHGVHHAHQRHILHRDLKPANVLLTPREPLDDAGSVALDRCVPKITDFGLAKRLEGDHGHTRDGAVMGTPAYMAPEQAQGKIRELGPPADVYALGAILYDLLTGGPPFKGETVMDTLHQVIHRDPVAPQPAAGKVPADLGTICLKCLDKDPGKRYASADALAEDLRRFLDGEPILARPASWREKLVKWAKRRPAAAALAAVGIAIAMGLGVGGYIFAGQEAQRAADEAVLRQTAEADKVEADAQRQRAEDLERVADHRREAEQKLRELAEQNFQQACAAVNSLLVIVGHERLAHEPRMERLRQELLQKAAAFYEDFLHRHEHEPAVRWQTARTQKNLGDIQEMLGQPKQAEQRYRQALAGFELLHIAAPDDRRYREDLAATQHNLGLLLLQGRRFPDAEAALKTARSLRSELLLQKSDAALHAELASSDHALGLLYEQRGDNPAAAAAFRGALIEQEPLAAAAPLSSVTGRKAHRDLARTLNSLGRAAQAAARAEEAAAYFDRAREQLDQLTRASPNEPEMRQELAQTYNNLAHLRRDTDPVAAERDYSEAIRLTETLARDFPATPAYRQDLAATLNNLGVLLQDVGRAPDAERAFSRALTLKDRLATDVPWVPDFRRDLAAVLNNRGIQLQMQNRAADADAAYGRAVALLQGLVAEFGDVPDYQRELARTMTNQAALLQARGKHTDAEKTLDTARTLQEALANRPQALPEHRAELARTLLAQGTLCQVRGMQAGGPGEQARVWLVRSEAEYRAGLAQFKELAAAYPEEPDFRYQQAIAANALASVLSALGHPQEARDQWKLAAELLEPLTRQKAASPGYRADLARALHEWGLSHAADKQAREAKELWQRARDTQAALVQAHPQQPAYRQDLARTEGNLANLAVQGSRLDEATAHFRKAVEALEGLKSAAATGLGYCRDVMARHRDLARHLADGGSPREVEQERRRALELARQLAVEAPDDPALASDRAMLAQDLAAQLVEQNRAKEARPLLEEAVGAQRAAAKAGPGVPAYRQNLIVHLATLIDVLLQLDDHTAAAAAVEVLLKEVPADWPNRHQAAAALARCAALADADQKLTATQRKELAQANGDRALATLGEAAKHGFKDADYLKNKEFDSLRQRADFQELAKRLTGK